MSLSRPRRPAAGRRSRLLVAALALSCAHAPSPDRRPERGGERARSSGDTILFMGVDFPPAGTVIGGAFAGAQYEVRQATFQLSDAARARWSDRERERGSALMRGAGFAVEDVGPATSDARRLIGVQYGLTGRVSAIEVRSLGTAEPPIVEAGLDVSWELLDLGSGGAVFGRLAHGAARLAGTVDSAVGRALDDALVRLLGDTLFLRALAVPRRAPEGGGARFARRLPPDDQPIVLADGDRNASHDTSAVARVAAGVVSLRGPGRSYGTGFLLTRDGLGLAVGRSVRGAVGLRARLASGVETSARVLRSHAGLDVALIQVACPEDCPTVDWSAPRGVDVFTQVVAVGAPETEEQQPPAVVGQVGGRWGLANGVTLEGTSGRVRGGWPVARTSSGRVFGLVSARPGRISVLLLSEVLEALGVQPPAAER